VTVVPGLTNPDSGTRICFLQLAVGISTQWDC